MSTPALPLPRETLFGCTWLPRILGKAEQIKRGELPDDYVRPFCHPKGVDGRFLNHFELSKDDILAVAGGSEDEVREWFLSQPAVSEESIAAWNEYGENLGRPGQDGERMMAMALRRISPELIPLKPACVYDMLEMDETGAAG